MRKLHCLPGIACAFFLLLSLRSGQAATPAAPGSGPTPGPVPSAAPGANGPGSDNAGAAASAASSPSYGTASPDMPTGLTAAPETIWRRSTLLGDLGGTRETLVNHGITISPVYTGEVMGNVSGGAGGYNGVGRGVIYEHMLNVPVDLDLAKIVPAWQDATIHANALWIAGPGLSPSYTGDISNTSNIQGFNTVRLQELWYQQGLWNKRISVKVGEIAADSEFFTSDTASLFINGTFGAFTFVGMNLTDANGGYNPNVYPVASPGVRILVQPVSNFYLMSGVFSGNAETQTANPNGVAFPLNSGGLLLFNEAGFLLNQSPNDRGLQGTYKLGSFVHTHNFDTWDSQAADALAVGALHSEGVDYGIYGVVDQQIYLHGQQAVSLFSRFGYAPNDVNAIDWYYDGGFNFTGFVPGRKNDVAGIAVARSHFSGNYSDFQVAANGTNAYDAETVLEATYKAQITPWWTVQPDFQYIFTPSGQEGSKNAAVIGVRTSVAF
jgi:porin